MSWKQYNSTIKTFFNYLIEEISYLNLESIRIDDFRPYIRRGQEQRGELYSRIAICNKFRHISSLLMALHKNKIITQNPYPNIEEEELIGLEFTEKKESIPLSDKKIDEMYKAMIKTRDVVRNLLLLDFIFNIPIRNQEITNLKVSDIDVDNMIMQVADREVPIRELLLERLQNYLDERLARGIEHQYVFCRKYEKAMDKMTEASISDLINNAVKWCNFT